MKSAHDPAPIALVTGANRGIGLEIARQLAARGLRVFLGIRDPLRGMATADKLAAIGARVVPITLDVADPASITAAVQEFSEQTDRLDVLVNNAAILEDDALTILEITADHFDRVMRTNVRGPMLVTQAFWPFLSNARGRVINVSSGAGSLAEGGANIPIYGVSKTALNSLTRKFALTGAADGIVVNSICPGWVRTDMGGPQAERSVEQGADTAVWLATEAPRKLTGKFFRDRKEIAW
jgi:NAD(P)-dependent dehydrogenase (short-subunit alcohol dehydrogenase family)